MCRYHFSQYKSIYACFRCRKGFKHRLDKDLLSIKELKALKENRFKLLVYKKQPVEKLLVTKQVKCPDCGHEMANLGRDVRLPKKDKKEEWLAIEYLHNNNFNFFSCGCTGIGIVPQNRQQAYQLVEQQRRKTEGEILLQRLEKNSKYPTGL